MTTSLSDLSASLEDTRTEDILADAAGRFPGRITFGTGFGMEGCCIIDMVARLGLNIDLYTLDTGVLFPETYDLWKRLEAKYGLKIRAVRPRLTIDQQAAEEGANLWEQSSNRCCELRKIEPQAEEMKHWDAWISAIRRDQTPDRAAAQIYERDEKFGLVKVNPLVTWTSRDVATYIMKHGVPHNPLHDLGYPSIGCQPCTSAVLPGEDPRAGRWRGQAKTECGLHTRTPPGIVPIRIAIGGKR